MGWWVRVVEMEWSPTRAGYDQRRVLERAGPFPDEEAASGAEQRIRAMYRGRLGQGDLPQQTHVQVTTFYTSLCLRVG